MGFSEIYNRRCVYEDAVDFSEEKGGGSSLEISVFLRILMTHPVFFAAYRKFF